MKAVESASDFERNGRKRFKTKQEGGEEKTEGAGGGNSVGTREAEEDLGGATRSGDRGQDVGGGGRAAEARSPGRRTRPVSPVLWAIPARAGMQVTDTSSVLAGLVDGTFEVSLPVGGDVIGIAEDMLPTVEGE